MIVVTSTLKIYTQTDTDRYRHTQGQTDRQTDRRTAIFPLPPKSDITIVFLGPDFLQGATISVIHINICMDFQDLLA